MATPRCCIPMHDGRNKALSLQQELRDNNNEYTEFLLPHINHLCFLISGFRYHLEFTNRMLYTISTINTKIRLHDK